MSVPWRDYVNALKVNTKNIFIYLEKEECSCPSEILTAIIRGIYIQFYNGILMEIFI